MRARYREMTCAVLFLLGSWGNAQATPAISLISTASPPLVDIGSQVNFEFLIVNTGIEVLNGPVTVFSNLLTVTCPALTGSFGPGVTVTCAALMVALEEGAYTITSVAYAFFSDQQIMSNQASVTYEVRNPNAPTVPEPATLALMGLGLAGMGFQRRQAS